MAYHYPDERIEAFYVSEGTHHVETPEGEFRCRLTRCSSPSRRAPIDRPTRRTPIHPSGSRGGRASGRRPSRTRARRRWRGYDPALCLAQPTPAGFDGPGKRPTQRSREDDYCWPVPERARAESAAHGSSGPVTYSRPWSTGHRGPSRVSPEPPCRTLVTVSRDRPRVRLVRRSRGRVATPPDPPDRRTSKPIRWLGGSTQP